MYSMLLFPLSPPFSLRPKLHNFPLIPFKSTSLVLFSPIKSSIRPSSFSDSPDYDREESRWMREEQRWLREEQRWLRVEKRWYRERELLLREIDNLKFVIQQNLPQGGASAVNLPAGISELLHILKDKNLIAESGSSARPIVLEEEEVTEKEVVVKEVVSVSKEEEGVELKTKRRMLRKGAEGYEVRAMQEALQKLGFYSGEEDMEFSSFSSGTERAVKTWQASLGAPEDGIMSTELLEKLFIEQPIKNSASYTNAVKKDGANGAPGASLTKISDIQEKVVEDSINEVGVSEHRVFLLGENRWEEPSRLLGRNKQVKNSRNATTWCATCRGEGRLMCSECDGTGEPNIEPQFLEWVEGTKCPYCEGVGHTICDACKGKR